MMTYNHEKYISQAIDGVLMQKATFRYQIVLGEDCSTDNTRKIVLKYAQQNPDKFKLILHNKNVGAIANQIAVLNSCTGKYIAMCEGDDYWTDPYKLQRQVDFLEKNKDFVLVSHPSYVYYENQAKPLEIYHKIKKDVLRKKDIISAYEIQIASVMFRREVFDQIDKSGIRVEHSLYILLSQYGKIKVLPDVMSVYRIHDNGASATSTPPKAYRAQIEWINNLKRIMGWHFFWGYHFLSSKVQSFYAIKYPEVFKGGSFLKYYYFFKYAILMFILYPRNIRSVFRMVPELLKAKTAL